MHPSLPAYARRAILLLLWVASGVLPGRAWAQTSGNLPPYWQWQNPLPQGYELQDLYVFNDTTALAVGNGGTVVKTTDGGRSWRTSSAGTNVTLSAVSFGNDNVGWTGHYNEPAAVRKTTDGGLTWNLQYLGLPYAAEILDLQALNSTAAYALYYVFFTGSTELRYTQDGGQTWVLQSRLLSGSPTRMQFVSPTVGFLFSGGGLRKTTDGGVTWRSSAPTTHPDYTDLAFLNAHYGWVRRGSALYRTRNGGQSWQLLSTPNTGIMAFADTLRGIIVSGNNFYHTADGGQTWTTNFFAQHRSSGNELRVAALRPSGVGWAVGNYGSGLRTRDFGHSWAYTDSLPAGEARFAQFLDVRHGWAAKNNHTLVRTEDGGNSWQPTDLSTKMPAGTIDWSQGFIQGMHFVDQDTGVVALLDYDAMSRPRLFTLATQDAGQSWTVTQLPPLNLTLSQANGAVTALRFQSARRGLMLGGRGRLQRTDDGGRTWTTPTLPPSINQRRTLLTATWLDAQTVYVGGDSLTLLKSTDGGLSFQALPGLGTLNAAQTQRQNWPVGSLTFASPLVAVIGYSDQVLRTTDGGQTWRFATPPADQSVVRNNFTAATFINAREGWLISNDNIAATTDGGQTWTRSVIFAPYNNVLSAGTRIDRYNGWGATAYGSSGYLLHYSEKTLITAPLAQTSYCTSDSLEVDFTREGTFGPTEQAVRVELSNARGRFRRGEVRVLGQGTASPLRVGLPANLAASALYRVRVVRADSSVLGSDNGQNLRIGAGLPAAALSQLPAGPLQAALPAGAVTPARYEWERDGGLLAGISGAQLASPANGRYRVRACSASCCGAWSDTLVVAGDLVVSSAQSVQGTYRNVTVTGPATGGAGVATLSGPLTVLGTITVQDGGRLRTGCQHLTGAGAFTLEAGATLHVCAAAGLHATGTTGAVQVSGPRSFSPDASYVYDGTEPQVTGPGLPAQVRNLAVDNPTGLTQSQAVAVAQVLALRRGDLNTAGQPLTLLSTAAGTALIDNAGGLVRGPGTMQRFLDQPNAAGVGYRHYAAPVSNTTLADLTTSSYTPVLNPAFNSSTTPSLVAPFPTLYGYAEDRLSTSPATTGSTFDKGWYSPTTLAEPMPVGRGFTAWVPTGALVDFTGTFTSGPVTVGSLGRGPQTDAGWHLLGNPYPSPLDWRRVAPTEHPGLDAALYVFQSTGPYTGAYRTTLNGLGDPLIPAGAGFFVRTTTAGTTGSLTLTNAHRLTSFGPQPAFGRDTADARPRLQLRVLGAGVADVLYLYLQAGAGSGVLPAYDATKLTNSTGLNLASLSGPTPLAINGLPPLAQTEEVVPLTLTVPQTGGFTFEVAELANFDAATVYLRDAHTGTQTPLTPQTRYAFTLASATAGTGRFSLVLRPGVLAAQGSSALAAVRLYPNPARGSFRLVIPPVTSGHPVEATLLNALGQVVRQLTIPVRAGGAEVDVRGLPAGVYAVRVRSGQHQHTQRVVLE